MSREVMAAVRWWRLRPWSANPLMRGSDRIEAVAVVLMVAAVLMLVPLAGVVGTVSYAQLTERSHQEITGSRQVPALVLDNGVSDVSVRETVPESSSVPEPVRARWEVDGIEHTGQVGLETRARVGETVRIWVDEAGNYIPAPQTGTENAIAAFGTASAFLALGAMGCVVTVLGVHGVMNRHRMARWQQEWQQVRRIPGWPLG